MGASYRKGGVVTIQEIRRRARLLDVPFKGGDKVELIRAIQAAEKNPQCFRTGRTQCAERACCWLEDCMSPQSPD